MSYEYSNIRGNDVAKSRVGHITKGYASGGAVTADAPVDRKSGGRTGKSLQLKMDGGVAKPRMDRPGRARGGRSPKSKGNNVNVIIAPQGGVPGLPVAGGPGPMSMVPKPPMPMAGPPGGPPPMPPPGMGPPSMPHANGGRTYAKGGAVKKRADGGIVEGLIRHAGKIRLRDEMGGKPPGYTFKSQRDPTDADDQMRGQMQRAERISDEVPRKQDRARGGAVFEEGRRNGTQVQPSPGHNDAKDMNRKRVVTYATGGPVNASPTGQHGPKFGGGAMGGKAKMQKAHRAAKTYAKA